MALLETIIQGPVASIRNTFKNAEDSADGHIHIDVGGPVQGVEHHHVVALGVIIGYSDHVGFFFRGHDAHLADIVQGINEDLVGKDMNAFHKLHPLVLKHHANRFPEYSENHHHL